MSRLGEEEAFLVLLRRLAGGEKGVYLAAVFAHFVRAVSEMCNAASDHVYAPVSVAFSL